jgi:hypothetical protein
MSESSNSSSGVDGNDNDCGGTVVVDGVVGGGRSSGNLRRVESKVTRRIQNKLLLHSKYDDHHYHHHHQKQQHDIVQSSSDNKTNSIIHTKCNLSFILSIIIIVVLIWFVFLHYHDLDIIIANNRFRHEPYDKTIPIYLSKLTTSTLEVPLPPQPPPQPVSRSSSVLDNLPHHQSQKQKKQSRFAYVTLLSGIDSSYRYRGFLYNVLIMRRALDELGR